MILVYETGKEQCIHVNENMQLKLEKDDWRWAGRPIGRTKGKL